MQTIEDYAKGRRGKRRVISGELFQSELFWRVIFMQIRLFIVMNLDSLQSQLFISIIPIVSTFFGTSYISQTSN